jgi:uncharacterized protein YbjQ (UPF0145 family)
MYLVMFRKINRLFIPKVYAFICLLLVSCSGPAIHYLGDSYQPTASVEIYYDAKEVQKEYKVIGRMTNDKFMEYDPEIIKEEMLKKAKSVGADAIIFYDLSAAETEKVGDIVTVKAQLIKYL